MKSHLTTALSLLTTTTLAAKYAPGTNCHSNIECSANCLNSQFTILNLDGGYIFACDAAAPDPTDWYSLHCNSDHDANGDFAPPEIDAQATMAACETLGGQVCLAQCALSGKRSADAENRERWAAGCGKDRYGFEMFGEIVVELDEEMATEFCR